MRKKLLKNYITAALSDLKFRKCGRISIKTINIVKLMRTVKKIKSFRRHDIAFVYSV